METTTPARVTSIVALFLVATSCFADPTTLIVSLRYANAADAPRMIQSLAEAIKLKDLDFAATKLEPQLPQNAVIVTGEADQVALVRKLAAAIDRPTKQVRLSVQRIRTSKPEVLLGIPLTTRLKLDGKDVEVPNGLLLPGPPQPLAGAPRPPEVTPGGVRTAICNPAFDPNALLALLASGAGEKLGTWSLTTTSGMAGSLELAPGDPAAADPGLPGEEPQTDFGWVALEPTVRDDGAIVIVAALGQSESAASLTPLRAAWIAAPDAPVVVGEVPRTVGSRSLVYIVTASIVNQ